MSGPEHSRQRAEVGRGCQAGPGKSAGWHGGPRGPNGVMREQKSEMQSTSRRARLSSLGGF